MPCAPLPSPLNFRVWRSDFYQRCLNLSPQAPADTLQWLQATEDPDRSFESLLEPPQKKWRLLDQSIALGLSSVTKGDLQRKIAVIQERLLNQQRVLTGRATLWLIFDVYKVDANNAQLDFSALHKVKFSGTLESFQLQWQWVIAGLSEMPSDRQLESVLVEELRKVPDLRPELSYYDRLDFGHPDRSYTYLVNIMERCATRMARNRTTKQILDSNPLPASWSLEVNNNNNNNNNGGGSSKRNNNNNNTSTAAPAINTHKTQNQNKAKDGGTQVKKRYCLLWAKGQCNNPNCAYLHEHDPSKPLPSQATKEQNKPQGDKKDQNRSRSKSKDKKKDGHSQQNKPPNNTGQPSTHHKSVPMCTYFARGQCNRGTACRFRHEHPSSK
ncbi:MAG: hypothetical protein AAGJ35_08770, partial [Myxococcota bacterium]